MNTKSTRLFRALTKPIFFILLFFSWTIQAQKDAIYLKDQTEIRCKILKETSGGYKYAFLKSNSKPDKDYVKKTKVDSIRYNKYTTDLSDDKIFIPVPQGTSESDSIQSPFKFSFGIGLNMENLLEFNSGTGPDKKTFTATCAIDLGLDYYKEDSRFSMTNELHWTVSVQKPQIDESSHIQLMADELTTLHDFSYGLNKNNHWKFNLIAKTSTPVFTAYDGDYFKDYNNNGKIQKFINPYEVILSPGIKYQPDDYFRLSISPYSVSLYGLTDQEIANTGFYTQEVDENGNYEMFVFTKLGAEVNIWYDRKIKKWLIMQYRLSFSSKYDDSIVNNGLMNGLFITKFKIFKNVSLMHRGVLKGDFAMTPFKPYYQQTLLLNYSVAF